MPRVGREQSGTGIYHDQSKGQVPLIEEYNKWKNEGNTGEFIYEINPKISDK